MRTVLLLLLLVGSQQKTLLIGDSISAYRNGWQCSVASRAGWQLHNAAVGGKRTAWMLSTLKHELDSAHWDRVLIYGGINDAFSGVPIGQAVANVQSMVVLAKAHGAEPIVIVGYDPNLVIRSTGYSADVEAKCRARYVQFQEQLLRVRGCRFVPMCTTLTRADTDDGIHLNSQGHKKFRDWVYSHI